MALGGTSTNPSFVASATIHTSRAVKATATTGTLPSGATSLGVMTVAECGTSDQPVGVSQEGCLYAPGLAGTDETIAATSGIGLHVYGLGETCWVKVDDSGLAVTAGGRVRVTTSDGEIGPVVANVGGTWTLGIAITGGVPGTLVQVFIDPQQIAVPQS
jgi:hypothetical protein